MTKFNAWIHSPEADKGLDTISIGSKKAGIIKGSILALSAAALQACAPANAADGPQDKSEVIKVAENNAEVPVIDTLISSGEAGGNVEKEPDAISAEAGFSQIEIIIEDTLDWREEKKWMYIVNRLRKDNTVWVDEESFIQFALANKWEILTVFKKIQNIEEFPNLHNLVVKAYERKLDEEGRKLDEEGRKLDEEGRKLDEDIAVIDAWLQLVKNVWNQVNK